MATYQQLNQRHPSVNVARLAELCALYEGGQKLERLFPSLLPKRSKERQDRYDLRIKEAEHRNYLGPIIDYVTSMLFVSSPVLKAKSGDNPEPVETDEYWDAFREDCDRGGSDVDATFKQL